MNERVARRFRLRVFDLGPRKTLIQIEFECSKGSPLVREIPMQVVCLRSFIDLVLELTADPIQFNLASPDFGESIAKGGNLFASLLGGPIQLCSGGLGRCSLRVQPAPTDFGGFELTPQGRDM